MSCLVRLVPALLVVQAVLCSPAAYTADQLEKQLLAEAPKIIEALRAKGYRNIGVLKFRVKKGTEPATDRAGTLNRRLTQQLQLALILANPVKEPLGIVRDASRIAATIEGANHLKPEGRQKLFSRTYPLAWGEQEVTPDAFVTGAALISPDLSRATIGIMAFDQSATELQQLARFEVALDLEELSESGESFAVRGVFDQGALELSSDERKDKATAEALVAATKVKDETTGETKPAKSRLHPLAPENTDAPVSLAVVYDGKVQPLEFRGGAAFVAEPKAGQKVSLVVRRKGSTRPRLGIVLKVNGENTLERQTLPDALCSMWIFEPDRQEIAVQGYYVAKNQLLPFSVLSDSESRSKEIDYGEFVGTLSISVFAERRADPQPSPELLTDEGEDFLILTRGAPPEKAPRNFAALRQQLLQPASLTPPVARGLINPGAAQQQVALETRSFAADAIPTMTATVRYYNPQDLPE